MAIVKGAIQMTGSIKGVSFYTVRGSDRIIMRTKGGANKNKIQTSPSFEGLRKQQKEWSGCAKFGSVTRYAFGGLHRLADYNLSPVLNGMGKNLMKLDNESEVGKRSLKLTANKSVLEGFDFNRNFSFNTVLRVIPKIDLTRNLLDVVVIVPRINTTVDLLNIQKLPFFRLIVALGTVSDLYYDSETNDYKALHPQMHGLSNTVTGAWNNTQTIVHEHQIHCTLGWEHAAELTNDISVIVSMAVEFGNIGFNGEPVEVKYAGCGKVLACV